ncbi:MAG: DUF2783 domain-containing protein [Burkholderiales bacterium]|jgi:hypothetical protein
MADHPAAALITDPNIDRPDDFYQALIDAHRDLSEADSLRLNSRLILILANQVGSTDRLLEAIELARSTLSKPV